MASAFLTTTALAAGGVQIDPDDIGGVVTGAKGAEAGVWVIAETKDLATPYIKIVVTDDQGRYVLPDLPKGKYKVWVRGYGLVDSQPVDGAPGKGLNLTAVIAPDAKAAAEIYPANYWFALLNPPDKSEFPGTGPQGNGIVPSITSRNDWVIQVKENCLPCHQLGTKATRELTDTGNSLEAWDQRIQKVRSDDDPTLGPKAKEMTSLMTNAMTRYGRHRALQVFADWTDRIGKGEIPKETPPRPSGIERNLVITLWDWGNQRFVHDAVSSDRRTPTLNANGPVYGLDEFWGSMLVLDPVTHKTSVVTVPDSVPTRPGGKKAVVHNPMLDQKGRVWMTEIPSITGAPHPSFCTDAKASKYARYFPIRSNIGHEIALYDPTTKKIEVIDYCTNTQILQFQRDADNTLHMSGDANVMTWINTRLWDETRDPAKSFGWCPMVLDTNADGKITPDRAAWNEPGKPLDPKKDTRMSSYLYGMGINPADSSVWYAKFSPFTQSGIVRFAPGNNAPETCMTEYYEPPKRPDGLYSAYNIRGIEMDSKGVAWVAFGSGQIGAFDRAKCKVLNGPTMASGLHCPEGWTIYDTPGPKMPGQEVGSADWHYLSWVDLYDTLGLGKDVPIVNGTMSDSLVALQPGGKHVFMRVPYPMGFYTRSVDGRIDDPNAGWKGRGLWTSYQVVPLWHMETGEGSSGKVAKFQVRPDPLAH
ncbi:MAG: carboxypeptidase-like regulatory domain-containing protein [Rhodospirillaceae bacterium]|nr:carboxypeptidase-like regulatory domain-containing protein [Rhodospirillaceae bacterium]